MYYITVDGEHQAHEDFWEEALITAAQLDYMYNCPEMNDGVQGTHDIKIVDSAC